MTAIDTRAATTAATPVPAPDLGAVKRRQQATWASGDYHVIGTQIVLVSEQLVEASTFAPRTASSTSRPAAAMRRSRRRRRGATVVGIDYVPALLDRGPPPRGRRGR